jgi:predicted ATPase
MTVKRLKLQNFTAFEAAEFVFSPGINVLIGENSSGKTHALKCLYTLLKTCETLHRDQLANTTRRHDRLHDKFAGVFKADTVGRLVRRGRGRDVSNVYLEYEDINRNQQALQVNVTTLSKVSMDALILPNPAPSVYLPSREFLSIYEGFLAAYQQRETAFDETYYDLSLALNATPLRGPRLQETKQLLAPLEKIIRGQVEQKQGRFYVHLPEGKLEAHLVAEGYRKLATVMYLIKNGSLLQNGILFWDEPEANLNPKLVMVIIKFLQQLADSGVQVFLATHDYLLTQELSALTESEPQTPVRFFSLFRQEKMSGVILETGDTLAALEHNPILEEFAAHYDRTVTRFHQPTDKRGAA